MYILQQTIQLRRKKHNISNIYIWGSENLVEEFESNGFNVCNSLKVQNLLIGYNPDFPYEQTADAVQIVLQHVIVIRKGLIQVKIESF